MLRTAALVALCLALAGCESDGHHDHHGYDTSYDEGYGHPDYHYVEPYDHYRARHPEWDNDRARHEWNREFHGPHDRDDDHHGEHRAESRHEAAEHHGGEHDRDGHHDGGHDRDHDRH